MGDRVPVAMHCCPPYRIQFFFFFIVRYSPQRRYLKSVWFDFALVDLSISFQWFFLFPVKYIIVLFNLTLSDSSHWLSNVQLYFSAFFEWFFLFLVKCAGILFYLFPFPIKVAFVLFRPRWVILPNACQMCTYCLLRWSTGIFHNWINFMALSWALSYKIFSNSVSSLQRDSFYGYLVHTVW